MSNNLIFYKPKKTLQILQVIDTIALLILKTLLIFAGET